MNQHRTRFLSNALLLSAVNIAMRGLAVSFNAYVHDKIGTESMGLLTLVMSVYGFAVTLALSCVNLGALKLTSERCAQLDEADAASWKYAMRQVIRSVCRYSLLFGIGSGLLLWIFSEPIARYLLRDMRTLLSLRVLAVSLPAISLSSGLSGYFTGLRKVTKNAIVAVSEQFIKIIGTSAALVMLAPGNVEASCLAVVGGSAVAEGLSLVIHLILYLFDSGRPAGQKPGKRSVRLKTGFRDTAAISFPSAVGTYARQGLTTLEHLAIPAGLTKSGLTQAAALSSYGALQGIALPLVMFPYAVIGSFTTLLIPEMSELNEIGNRENIDRLTREVYKFLALFSMAACGIFINYAGPLGELIYHSSEAARYTFLLGLLVPFMYLDTAVDSLLKGLGEQVYIMKVNIADAASGLLLVMLFTPLFGIYGYLLTVWICEIGNLALSIYKLGQTTGCGVRQAIRYYVKPAAACAVMSVVRLLLLSHFDPIPSMLIFAGGYLLLTTPIMKTKKERPMKP